MKKNLTALEIYMGRVFGVLLVGFPCVAIIAALTFAILRLNGFYSQTPYYLLFIFIGSCFVYLILGIIIAKRCKDEENILKPKSLLVGKICIVMIECIQWNFITYLFPSRDFWGYFAFFIILTVFFLDHKFTLFNILTIVISIAISWIIKGDVLLPIKEDGLFIPNLVLRCVVIVLFSATIWFLTFLIEKLFVKELEKIADYDTLTLLRNRRQLDNELVHEIKNYHKNKQEFSVFMCDIDDFKKVNDTYGHDFGDQVLKNIATIMLHEVSNNGTVYRYGGEEFFAVLKLSKDETLSIAEHIRYQVEKTSTTYNDHTVNVTITLGVATYHDNITKEEIIKNADINLYYGKNHGKNRVVF